MSAKQIINGETRRWPSSLLSSVHVSVHVQFTVQFMVHGSVHGSRSTSWSNPESRVKLLQRPVPVPGPGNEATESYTCDRISDNRLVSENKFLINALLRFKMSEDAAIQVRVNRTLNL